MKTLPDNPMERMEIRMIIPAPKGAYAVCGRGRETRNVPVLCLALARYWRNEYDRFEDCPYGMRYECVIALDPCSLFDDPVDITQRADFQHLYMGSSLGHYWKGE